MPKENKGGAFSVNTRIPENERTELFSSINQAVSVFRKMGYSKPKTSSELINRIDSFFDTCNSMGIFPTIEKMCLAIGYSRQEVFYWLNDSRQPLIRQDTDASVKDIISLARDSIAAADADLANMNKVNAAVWIFRAKNFYGMTDSQTVVVQPQDNNIRPSLSMEEIAASMPAPELPEIE